MTQDQDLPSITALRQILDVLRKRPIKKELKDRHEGRIAELKSHDAYTKINRRDLNASLLSILLAGATSTKDVVGFLADGHSLATAFTDGDTLKEGDWSVSPRFADLILQGSYNVTEAQSSSALTNGDRAVLQSCKMHANLDIVSVKINIPHLVRTLESTTSGDARAVVQSRLLVDYNLLSRNEDISNITKSAVEEALENGDLSPHAKARLLDYASTAILNSTDGEQLRTCSPIGVTQIFDMYDKFGFSAAAGQHFGQIATYGLGVYSMVQAHYIRELSADGADAPSVRRSWVRSVVEHMHFGQECLPTSERINFAIDGIYSLSRPAYSAAIDGDWEHVEEITRFVEDNAARWNCKLTPSLQWTHLLETNRLIRLGKLDHAQARHMDLLNKRRKLGFATPDKHALEKAVEETSFYVSHEYTSFASSLDVAEVNFRRGNLDALSLPVRTRAGGDVLRLQI